MSLAQNVVVVVSFVLLSTGASGRAPGSDIGGTTQAAAGSPRATWEKRLVEAVKPKPFGVRYDIVISESPVPASTRDEFLRALNVADRAMVGDRTNATRSPGSFQYRVSWEWRMETHLSECGFKELTINVDFSIDVAQLAGPLAEDSTARVWWAAEVERQFPRRVETLKVLRDGAKSLQRTLKAMNSTSCSTLAERANAIGQTAVVDIYAQVETAGRTSLVR